MKGIFNFKGYTGGLWLLLLVMVQIGDGKRQGMVEPELEIPARCIFSVILCLHSNLTYCKKLTLRWWHYCTDNVMQKAHLTAKDRKTVKRGIHFVCWWYIYISVIQYCTSLTSKKGKHRYHWILMNVFFLRSLKEGYRRDGIFIHKHVYMCKEPGAAYWK